MTDTRVSGYISVEVMLEHFECKHTGFLSIEWKMLGMSKWILKYFIISKGGKEGCVWNFFCFDNELASKQAWSISMREVESILEYNKGIVGINIVFSNHMKPVLILKCDTAKNRETWLKMFKEAHVESQTCSADSGFGSGGSVTSRNSRRFDNQRDSEYMYSRVREINDDIKAPEKVNDRYTPEPFCSNKDDPLLVNNDGVLRRHAANSRNENSQHRNQVIVGDDKDMTELVPNESCLEYENGLRVFRTKDYKMSAKVEDSAVTDECNRKTDIPCVKESLPSSVQETKSCSTRYETLATTVHSKHELNPAKTIVQAQSDQLKSPFRSDNYENFELGQDENTRPKVIEDNADFEYTMADSDSAAFMSVAGCSDSFVSVRKSKLDSNSHSIGTSEGDKNSDHVLTKENTFKLLKVGKPPENEGHLQKHTSSPNHHDYYPPGPLFESSKENRVPPFSIQGIKGEDAESLRGICSKHDEEITSEKSVLPKDNGDENFYQASTSSSKQTKLAGTTITEKTPQSFESNIDDECSTYENITVSENKEQKIFSNEENEIKRGSNISTKSTSNSGSDSSTDSVTYESPDEGAQHENGNFFREEEYYCEHPEYIKRNLQNNPPGTFLICNIRSKQVLCLVTDDGIKRFIIHRQEDNLSLFKDGSNTKNTFPNLNKLLSYYREHDLPSNNFTERLKRAYKSDKED